MRNRFHLTREEQIVKQYLIRALDPSTNSVLSLKLIRRFASETPDLFCNAALSILHQPDDSPAQRFMSILLLKQSVLLPYLSNPYRFDKEESVNLFKYLMTVDKSLDIRLARCLPNRNGISEMNMPVNSSERALDILDETSSGRRIIPILSHLMDHLDTRLSSKATLLIGKRVQSVTWAKRFLKPGADPRLRANAIESIWGVQDPHAKDLLWDHTGDANNRVAGNAVFGLHVLGEEKVISSVLHMANNAQPEFRWTSAWTMSKIGDTSFVPPLSGMIKDECPGVRRAALKALVTIHKEVLRQQALEEKAMPTTLEEVPKDQVELLEQGPVIKPEINLRLDGRSFSFRDRV